MVSAPSAFPPSSPFFFFFFFFPPSVATPAVADVAASRDPPAATAVAAADGDVNDAPTDFSPPTIAATGMIGACSYLDPCRAFLRLAVTSLTFPSLSSSGKRSVLFRAMTREGVVISARMTHSTVWACRPRVASTTRRTRSMICAPPMMVRISEACPGQSTRVICKAWLGVDGREGGREGRRKEEKPKSRVMPRSRD